MKWTLISFLCIVAISNVVGQEPNFADAIKGEFPINIASDKIDKTFTPPQKFPTLKSGTINKSEIIVNYVNFPEEAKVAFEYAVSIYEKSISSSVPIVITANWENMNEGILAKSGSSKFYKNFNESLISNVYYPIALVEKLSGREWNDEKDPDIITFFDSDRPWYFGTNGNTPTTKFDFVTVALHEIAHGLGISGFLMSESGYGKFSNPANNPSAYDYYIFNSKDQRISDKDLFSSPSQNLHRELTSNKLDFSCVNNSDCSKAEIYAPTTWRNGASIYHLKNSATSNSKLMCPTICKGRAIHNLGENTLKVLSDIGWGAVTLDIAEIKDFDKTAEFFQIKTKFDNNDQFNNSKVEMVFSTDYFSTKDSVTLKFNNESNKFEGNLPLNNFMGKVHYYYKLVNSENEVVTKPYQAPKKTLSFKIYPDYYSPTLQHNPIKLISNINAPINFLAIAIDNLGINKVSIEYIINGVKQQPIQLKTEKDNIYKGCLFLPEGTTSNDFVEYRIIAEDASTRLNKKYLPSKGYYNMEIFEPEMPVKRFFSDFNSFSENFTTNDFVISTPAGFSNGNLHTNHPYANSSVKDKRHNSITLLKSPVILKENGQLTFDEVVLVEPGQLGAKYTEKLFCDFVIVEGSKNNGKTWHPFIDGYDSGEIEEWVSKYSKIEKSTSIAAGDKNLFFENSINLTDNEFFSAGDTVLIRFRLASDKSVSGWGWAIDNLGIQNSETTSSELFAYMDIKVYPNPFSGNLFFNFSNLSNTSEVVIKITDLVGRIVYQETKYDSQYNPKLQVNLSDIQSGIYIASITDANLNTITQKIIKN